MRSPLSETAGWAGETENMDHSGNRLPHSFCCKFLSRRDMESNGKAGKARQAVVKELVGGCKKWQLRRL
jgi:hypothetical protein